ncbi:MAG TPA: hypothetical protein VJA22_01115 [Patescibacteria group bacterium]|nr:hypothetical protein [Patescibacteria group bacterium]
MKKYYVGFSPSNSNPIKQSFSAGNLVLLDHDSPAFVHVPVNLTEREVGFLESHITHRLPFYNDQERSETHSLTAQLMLALARAGFFSDFFPDIRVGTAADWSEEIVMNLLVESGVAGVPSFLEEHNPQTVVSLAKRFAQAGLALQKSLLKNVS